MKKTLFCLISAFLIVFLLCGCSLFAEKETQTEDTTAETVRSSETEPPVLEPWGAPFAAEGTKQQIAYTFLRSVFPEQWRSLFSCEVKTKITKWGIEDTSDADSIRVYITYAVYASDPTADDNAILSEGNFQIGKDEYEGAVILTRYFHLQKQEDGNWQCLGFGMSW